MLKEMQYIVNGLVMEQVALLEKTTKKKGVAGW